MAAETTIVETEPDRSLWPLWIVSAAMAAGGVIVFGRYADRPTALPDIVRVPWWLLAIGFGLAEMRAHYVRFRGDTYTYSLADIVLVVALFSTSPGGLMLAQVLACGIVLGVIERQRPLKLCFNLSQMVLATSCAIAVFHALPLDGAPFSVRSWATTFAAASTSSMIGLVAIAIAISVAQGRRADSRQALGLAFGEVAAVVNTMLALVIVIVCSQSTAAVVLLIGPMVFVIGAYRAYLSEHSKSQQLEFVCAASEVVNQSDELNEQLLALLDFARETFHAEVAEIVLRGDTDQSISYRTVAGPRHATRPLQPIASDTVIDVLELATTSERVAVDRPAPGSRLALRNGINVACLMAAQLRDASGVRGVVLVTREKHAAVERFDKEEIRLFETFANQLDTTLERSRLHASLAELDALQQELSHRASHDPLTGLANRVLFRQRVDEALGAAAGGAGPAVLVIDLDDFKAVNDTLGHPAGDALLEAIGHRIQSQIGPDDTAARLGGDEFAVLVKHSPRVAVAHAVAARILASLADPIDAGGRALRASMSIGIALPMGGTTASELMKRADQAMYVAKRAGKGQIEHYSSATVHELAAPR